MFPLSRPLVVLLTATIFAPAAASAQAVQGSPPQRVRELTVAKNQPCPKSTADEVVVCRTLEDPYRIPKEMRDAGPIPAQRSSWAARQGVIDDVSKRDGGVPGSCSPVGTAGQTGCWNQLNKEYAADRVAKRSSDTAAAGE